MTTGVSAVFRSFANTQWAAVAVPLVIVVAFCFGYDFMQTHGVRSSPAAEHKTLSSNGSEPAPLPALTYTTNQQLPLISTSDSAASSATGLTAGSATANSQTDTVTPQDATNNSGNATSNPQSNPSSKNQKVLQSTDQALTNVLQGVSKKLLQSL